MSETQVKVLDDAFDRDLLFHQKTPAIMQKLSYLNVHIFEASLVTGRIFIARDESDFVFIKPRCEPQPRPQGFRPAQVRRVLGRILSQNISLGRARRMLLEGGAEYFSVNMKEMTCRLFGGDDAGSLSYDMASGEAFGRSEELFYHAVDRSADVYKMCA